MPPDEPAPATPAPTVTVVTPLPAPGEGNETSEQIAAITTRIDAAETRIAEIAEGRAQWETTTITSLKQELADLKATLAAVTENQPGQIAALREELTRLQQEISRLTTLQAEPPETEQIDPPIVPPAPEGPPVEAPEGPRGPQTPTARRGKRVV